MSELPWLCSLVKHSVAAKHRNFKLLTSNELWLLELRIKSTRILASIPDALWDMCKSSIVTWSVLGAFQRYRPEIPEPAPSLSQHGFQLGYSSFSCYQNNHDSSGVYVLRSERENKHTWDAAQCVKIVNTFCLRLFPCLWLAKIWIPPIGDVAISKHPLLFTVWTQLRLRSHQIFNEIFTRKQFLPISAGNAQAQLHSCG